MVSALLENYNLGIPADRVLFDLTYSQIYMLLEKIPKKENKTNNMTVNDIKSNNDIAVVNDFADMWR